MRRILQGLTGTHILQTWDVDKIWETFAAFAALLHHSFMVDIGSDAGQLQQSFDHLGPSVSCHSAPYLCLSYILRVSHHTFYLLLNMAPCS
jgi:hypothetical protein